MDIELRKMKALREFTHEGQELKVGDPFLASNIDAGYLHKHGKAEYSEATTQAPAAASAPPPAPEPAQAPALAAEQLGQEDTQEAGAGAAANDSAVGVETAADDAAVAVTVAEESAVVAAPAPNRMAAAKSPASAVPRRGTGNTRRTS